MTSYSKDFVVKNGLVVEGAYGTIDGDYIVTESALDTSLGDYVALTEKGAADGVAELDLNENVLTNTAVIFEGTTENEYQTTLDVLDPTADRTITLPNTTGTVITTGNPNDVYPSLTGNAGKYLKTDGSTVEWATVSGGGGSGSIVVTDAYTSGDTIYIGDVQPTSPITGAVWIDESSVTGSITWGQLKALGGIASGG